MKIHINHLTKRYGKIQALEDVSLDIPGGMFGLLGPNGAGKTTLMRILATLLQPTSGEVRVEDLDILEKPAALRPQLGYIPQDFGFYKNLNAYEMLDYIAIMKNIPALERKKQVLAVLEQVNLTRDARRRVGGYSGGMRQRMGIAQALLGNPKLMIVDEPTAGLDPEERIRFRNLLAGLSQQRTVLLSTHIVADIEASCTGVAVLDRGRLIFNGSLAELGQRAQGKVWQLEAPAQEHNRLDALGQVISSRAVNGSMQVRMIAEHNPLGVSIPIEPTLEDGYIAVMRGEPHGN